MGQKTNKSEKILPGACSCMTLTSQNGKHYWFRTCDIDNDIWKSGAHVVRQAAGEEIQYCDGKKEVCKYNYTGMTYNHLDTWLLDGVNEHGLCGGLLMLYEGISVDKASDGKEGYIGMELVTKILSFCKDVEEVESLAEQIQVLDIPWESYELPATMHYFFTDNVGNEVILEATEQEYPGILKVFTKEEILGVMTNSPPYEEQLQNLAWFLSQSPEMKQGWNGRAVTEKVLEVNRQELVKLVLDGRSIKADENANHLSRTGTFPASYSSYDRFIRLAVLKALNNSGNDFEDEKMLALGSGIMNAVCEPRTKGVFHYTRIEADGSVIGQKDSFTQYMVMYDIEEKSFWIKKYDEVTWKKYYVVR